MPTMTLTYNTYKNTNCARTEKATIQYISRCWIQNESFVLRCFISVERTLLHGCDIFDELQKNNVNVHNEKCRTTKCVSKCINSKGAKICMIHI